MGKVTFLPTLLIPEVYHPYSREQGFYRPLIEKLAADGFYQAIEVGCDLDQQERKTILAVSEEQNWGVTQWLTDMINRENLDVSSVDRSKRQEAVKRIKESLSLAAECGAANVAFISGPDPGASLRHEAAESFYQSLCEICEEAAQYKLTVLVEPLDRKAHKKRFLGPTREAVQLFASIRESFSNIGFAFDTAHAALNGETLDEALASAQSLIQQLHFSNAVLQADDDLYGDHHLPIGKPGFLDENEIIRLLSKVEELELGVEKLRVSIEVRGSDKQLLHENEQLARTILERALNETKSCH